MKDYIANTIGETSRLIKFPKNLKIYIIKDKKYCSLISKTLPKEIQKHFLSSCLQKVTFSYNYKDIKLIVVVVTESNKYLLKNKKALIGLLMHEIIHLKQHEFNKKIESAFNKKNYVKKLKKLKYNKKDIELLYNKIKDTSILLLKDLHSNNEIIKLKLENYLLSYYYGQFKTKRICPQPLFYEDIRGNVNLVSNAIEFELVLLSIILPFYTTKHAKKLIRYLSKCYETNIKEITDKCHDLVSLYLNEFGKKDFDAKFFDGIFNKVYMLLQ